jgi:hypothetical protein
MRRFRMVDMCKGKENMTTRHWWSPCCRIAHGWKKSKSFVSQQRDILSCTFIFLFHLIHPSLTFLATPLFSFYSFSFILSFSYFFSFFTFLYIILFPFHTHTFLFIFPSLDIFSKLSTPLFLACIQSEILNKPC